MDINYYLSKLCILYEDNHLLIVEKFVDVLSQKDATEDVDMTIILKEYLKIKYQKPGNVYLGLVHRLDRRVGGVLVCTKTSKAASRLSEDLRNKQFKKVYYAIVEGIIEDNGTYRDYLVKDENKRVAKIVTKEELHSQEAILSFEKIKTLKIDNEDYSLVKIDLKTGRYNQIRVQMAYHNHPLINDYKYGSKINGKELGLWCYSIAINHPVTHQQLTFVSEPQGKIWSN